MDGDLFAMGRYPYKNSPKKQIQDIQTPPEKVFGPQKQT